MSVTRVLSLLEQSIITAQGGLAPQVRAQLDCASASDVQSALIPITSQIASISGINIAQASQIASISGINIAQSTQIASISAGLATAGIPRAEVQAISAGLFTDIENLDVSLTQSIVTLFNTSGTAALTPSTIVAVPTSAAGWIQLSCNGTNIKIPFYIG